MHRLKRKHKATKGDTKGIVESFKKVRIAVSAGELRLRTDFVECEDLFSSGFASISVDQQNSLQLHASFKSNAATFLIVVPRFYPHKPPTVVLVNNQSIGSIHSPYIGNNGRVLLPLLTSGWFSVFTLRDIVLELERFGRHLTSETR